MRDWAHSNLSKKFLASERPSLIYKHESEYLPIIE